MVKGMQDLLRIKTNIVDWEKHTEKQVMGRKLKNEPADPLTDRRRKGSGPPIRLAYNINGYWFYLTIRDWAFMSNMSISTVRNRFDTRLKNKKTIGQIIGFEKLPRAKNPQPYKGGST